MGGFIWGGINFNKQTRINVFGAHTRILHDKPQGWPVAGNLVITGFTYDRITEAPEVPYDATRRLDWLRRQEAYHPDPYTHLAKILREAGHDEEARKVLIAREDDRLRRGDLSRMPWIWQWVLCVTIRHGYRPFRALGMALLVVALGTTVFMDARHTANMVPAKERVLMDPTYKDTKLPPVGYPVFNPLIYSADTFFPIVDLHQEAYWQPNGRQGCWITANGTPCARWYRGYLWFHIAAGWVLTTLFALGLSGLVRRET
jgi:hypothetical protein